MGALSGSRRPNPKPEGRNRRPLATLEPKSGSQRKDAKKQSRKGEGDGEKKYLAYDITRQVEGPGGPEWLRLCTFAVQWSNFFAGHEEICGRGISRGAWSARSLLALSNVPPGPKAAASCAHSKRFAKGSLPEQ